MLSVEAIDHLVFNVRDVEISAVWYERVLGMRRQDSRSSSGQLPTSMLFGRNKINLRPADASQEEWFTAGTPSTGSTDLCFLTQASPDEVTEHFRQCGVAIAQGPIEKSGACGAICSVYVRDPDGSLIEVSSYVKG